MRARWALLATVAVVVVLLVLIPVVIRRARRRAWELEAQRVKDLQNAEQIAKDFLAQIRPDLPGEFRGSRVEMEGAGHLTGALTFSVTKDCDITVRPESGAVIAFRDRATGRALMNLKPTASLITQAQAHSAAMQFVDSQWGRIPPLRFDITELGEFTAVGVVEWHVWGRRVHQGIPFLNDLAFAYIDPISGKVYLWTYRIAPYTPEITVPTVSQQTARVSALAFLQQWPSTPEGAHWIERTSADTRFGLNPGLCYVTQKSETGEVVPPRLGWLFWFETDRPQHLVPGDPSSNHPMYVELFVDGFTGAAEVELVSN